MAYFAHPSSFVDEGSVVGDGTKIWHFSHVMPGARIGERCNIGQNVVISPDVVIGNNVKIQNNVKRGATLGANSTLVCGHNVGRYAFVGAGAVVTRDVPDYALVLGNPARVAGWMCQCGVKLSGTPKISSQAELQCAACGAHYHGTADGHVERREM